MEPRNRTPYGRIVQIVPTTTTKNADQKASTSSGATLASQNASQINARQPSGYVLPVLPAGGSAGPKKIVKSMKVLDPTKLRILGLDAKIMSAVAKRRDDTSVNNDGDESQPQPGTTQPKINIDLLKSKIKLKLNLPTIKTEPELQIESNLPTLFSSSSAFASSTQQTNNSTNFATPSQIPPNNMSKLTEYPTPSPFAASSAPHLQTVIKTEPNSSSSSSLTATPIRYHSPGVVSYHPAQPQSLRFKVVPRVPTQTRPQAPSQIVQVRPRLQSSMPRNQPTMGMAVPVTSKPETSTYSKTNSTTTSRNNKSNVETPALPKTISVFIGNKMQQVYPVVGPQLTNPDAPIPETPLSAEEIAKLKAPPNVAIKAEKPDEPPESSVTTAITATPAKPKPRSKEPILIPNEIIAGWFSMDIRSAESRGDEASVTRKTLPTEKKEALKSIEKEQERSSLILERHETPTIPEVTVKKEFMPPKFTQEAETSAPNKPAPIVLNTVLKPVTKEITPELNVGVKKIYNIPKKLIDSDAIIAGYLRTAIETMGRDIKSTTSSGGTTRKLPTKKNTVESACAADLKHKPVRTSVIIKRKLPVAAPSPTPPPPIPKIIGEQKIVRAPVTPVPAVRPPVTPVPSVRPQVTPVPSVRPPVPPVPPVRKPLPVKPPPSVAAPVIKRVPAKSSPVPVVASSSSIAPIPLKPSSSPATAAASKVDGLNEIEKLKLENARLAKMVALLFRHMDTSSLSADELAIFSSPVAQFPPPAYSPEQQNYAPPSPPSLTEPQPEPYISAPQRALSLSRSPSPQLMTATANEPQPDEDTSISTTDQALPVFPIESSPPRSPSPTRSPSPELFASPARSPSPMRSPISSRSPSPLQSGTPSAPEYSNSEPEFHTQRLRQSSFSRELHQEVETSPVNDPQPDNESLILEINTPELLNASFNEDQITADSASPSIAHDSPMIQTSPQNSSPFIGFAIDPSVVGRNTRTQSRYLSSDESPLPIIKAPKRRSQRTKSAFKTRVDEENFKIINQMNEVTAIVDTPSVADEISRLNAPQLQLNDDFQSSIIKVEKTNDHDKPHRTHKSLRQKSRSKSKEIIAGDESFFISSQIIVQFPTSEIVKQINQNLAATSEACAVVDNSTITDDLQTEEIVDNTDFEELDMSIDETVETVSVTGVPIESLLDENIDQPTIVDEENVTEIPSVADENVPVVDEIETTDETTIEMPSDENTVEVALIVDEDSVDIPSAIEENSVEVPAVEEEQTVVEQIVETTIIESTSELPTADEPSPIVESITSEPSVQLPPQPVITLKPISDLMASADDIAKTRKRKGEPFNMWSSTPLPSSKRTRRPNKRYDDDYSGTPVKPTRGRPPNRVVKSPDLDDDDNIPLSQYALSMPRSESNSNAPSMIDENSTESVETQPAKKKSRGRSYVSTSYNFESQGDMDSIICGRCKVELYSNQAWKEHLIRHNGCAWIEGVEPPLDLTDWKTLVAHMCRLKKKYDIEIFKCEECDVVRRSAQGIIDHWKICGKPPEEQKVQCEHCQRFMMPASISLHLRGHCSVLKKQQMDKLKEEMAELNNMTKSEPGEENLELSVTGRNKRNSVKKAEKLLHAILHTVNVEDFYRHNRVLSLNGPALRRLSRVIENKSHVKCLYKSCTFETTSLEEISKHHLHCPNTGDFGYYCKNCEFFSVQRQAIETHITDTHSEILKRVFDATNASETEASAGAESSDSDGSSGVSEHENEDGECMDGDKSIDPVKRKRVKNVKYDKNVRENELSMALLDVCQLMRDKDHPGFYKLSFKWTKEFRALNYSKNALFESLIAIVEGMSIVSPQVTSSYLPVVTKSPKFSVSPDCRYKSDFGKKTSPAEWLELNVFEAMNCERTSVIFCGGPIRTLDWATFPDDYVGEEYLAITCQSEVKYGIRYGDKMAKKCLIQIWRIGQPLYDTPTYEYSLAFDGGPVYAMKFCPSGGYIPEKRLGILAVASMMGNVYLYALPFQIPDGVAYRMDHHVLNLSPSLILSLRIKQNHEDSMKHKVTQLVWNKEKGHSIIVAGYANGLVAIWNISSTSPLLRVQHIVFPTHIFYPFAGNINILDIKPSTCNSRYLIVGSEKNIKMYDLRSFSQPMMLVDHRTANDALCGVWPLHWSGFVIGREEGSFLGHNGILLKHPYDIGYKNVSLQNFDTSVFNISYNDWLNVFLSACDNGDIYALYGKELQAYCFQQENRKGRLLLGYTDCIRLDQKQSSKADTSIDDDDYPDEFGVIFCDIKEPIASTPHESNFRSYREPPLTITPMHSINVVSHNPNFANSNYYALGYFSGFVRIKNLPARKKFIERKM